MRSQNIQYREDQAMTEDPGKKSDLIYRIALAVIIMLQFIAALYFSTQKNGFHYDEYYSYYSSNVSYGLVPADNEWMDTGEISDEFMVLKGQGFNYPTVKLMQTYDVHPPFYYYILHTVCSLTPGVFSKWQGLTVNLIFWLLSFPVLIAICNEILCKQYKTQMIRILGEKDNEKNYKLCKLTILFIVFLYGFSPAILSGVMFIRMYTLLTFLCLLTVLMALKVVRYVGELRAEETGSSIEKTGVGVRKKKQILYAIGSFALTFIGSQTHYYYIVFLFFVAAYITLYLFIRGRGHKPDFKNAFGYAITVILGLIASVAYYPSMLSHIFRGYRGTEATQAFFDMGNLRERAGLFVGLLDEYLIYGFFYVLILDALLFYLFQKYSKRRNGVSREQAYFDHRIGLVAFVTTGYFLVVLKTALLNAEEAVRYEMPVYAFIILLLVLAVVTNLKGLTKEDNSQKGNYGNSHGNSDRQKITAEQVLLAIIIFFTCFTQLFGLTKDKVLFLYKDDAASYDWAREHRDDTIVYIYNPDNQWMIWDDATELMQYDRIFFISASNSEEITDETVKNADHLYVYAVRNDEAMGLLKRINDLKDRENEPGVIRELQYADLYELK